MLIQELELDTDIEPEEGTSFVLGLTQGARERRKLPAKQVKFWKLMPELGSFPVNNQELLAFTDTAADASVYYLASNNQRQYPALKLVTDKPESLKSRFRTQVPDALIQDVQLVGVLPGYRGVQAVSADINSTEAETLAQSFYRRLITRAGVNLYTSGTQSPGAAKLWSRLSTSAGVQVWAVRVGQTVKFYPVNRASDQMLVAQMARKTAKIYTGLFKSVDWHLLATAANSDLNQQIVAERQRQLKKSAQ